MTTFAPNDMTLGDLAAVLEHLNVGYRERGVTTADVSAHDYRVFGNDEMFDVHAKVPSPTGIGSLYDDIAELSNALANPDYFPTAVDRMARQYPTRGLGSDLKLIRTSLCLR